MAAPSKAYTFANVSSCQTFLGNIASVAQAEGWTIDKDDISGNGELYLHSTGNGSQALYFSMKLLEAHDVSGLYHLAIQGNTGCDGGQDWLSQPGRWTSLWTGKYGAGIGDFYDVYDGRNLFAHWLCLPCTTQYVLANSQVVICVYDTTTLAAELKPNGRYCMFLAFGAFDSYKSNETEGNFILATTIRGKTQGSSDGEIHTWHTGAYQERAGDDISARDIRFHGLLWDSANLMAEHWWWTSDTTLKTRSLQVSERYCWHGSGASADYSNISKAAILYDDAIKWNNWCSRSVLIKPILTRWHQTATDTYLYPIGEWPWYAAVHHPYYRCGEIATIGSRQFMMFPLFEYDSGYGVAVEVTS